MDGNWIYKVTQYNILYLMSPLYPEFDLSEAESFYFTFDDAVAAIKGIAQKYDEVLYAFVVEQISVGDGVSDCVTSWLFDRTAKLLDYTIVNLTDKWEKYHFFGRPAARSRFKIGDIVEVRRGEKVVLGVIYRRELTVDWCWEFYNKWNGKDYNLNGTDDNCIVLFGPGYEEYDHISSLNIMKPHLPVPADLEAEMDTWIERFETPSDGATTCISSYEGEMVDMQEGYRICIKYDEKNATPLLLINDYYGSRIALRIETPEYFISPDYKDTLSDSQKRSLMNYLTKAEAGRTKWWYLLRCWNYANEDRPQYQLPLDMPIPDYNAVK